MVGVVFVAIDVQGRVRTSFEEGTTDGVGWFELDRIARVPHVELVDFVVELLADFAARQDRSDHR
jgi:hypothetical protein